jgi:hypothetical protein
MDQPSLFDADLSLALKARGIAFAEAGNMTELEAARVIAKTHPRAYEGITADDVNSLREELGRTAPLGNSSGALFRGGDWTPTGEYRNATRITSHARALKVWRLRCGF